MGHLDIDRQLVNAGQEHNGGISDTFASNNTD